MSRPTSLKWKKSRPFFLLILLLLVLLASGCKDTASPKVIKIGLIAPFEGPSRPLGYDVLYAVKLRVKQWNEDANQPKIILVALNDNGDAALAARLPAQLAQDPDVHFILGPVQGHTAMAALPGLAKTGVPTLLLGPVRDVQADNIIPYAGLGAAYQAILAPKIGIRSPAWTMPVSKPVIWLGDPLTLAELSQNQPDLVAAAGPVAEEEAFRFWAPETAANVLRAAPAPQYLPDSFAMEYEALAGKAPTSAAGLAYKATDAALHLIAQSPNLHPTSSQLHLIQQPPISMLSNP